MRPRHLLGLFSNASPVRSNCCSHIPPLQAPFHSTPSVRSASQWGPYGPRRPSPNYNRFNRAGNIYTLWYTSAGFRYGVGAVGLGGGAFYYRNLEQVPVSNRTRFNCVSKSFEDWTGEQSFQAVMQEYGSEVLPPSHPYSQQVNRVVSRLIPESGYEAADWEVRVIDDPEQKNAFVVPGGKVFVFSGILPICGGDDGLAAVLGHEIAHQVAHHTGEKLSKNGLVTLVALAAALTLDVSGNLPYFILDLALSRPGSRKMESEADFIGLLMMAKACYDPSAAVGLWQRMAKAEQNAPPQWLSTHPASENRIVRIQEWLPQAEEKRNQSECGSTMSYVNEFKRAFGSGGTGDEDFW